MRARHGGTTKGTRFLDPKTLSRIKGLHLVARWVVDGFIHGLHRAPYLGLSLDFAEHRAYMPGDDIRRVDWRLFARTDRFYVKEYEADTNSNAIVLLDRSRSMDFGTRGITKLDYARYLAACLTYFSSLQRDRVGFASLDGPDVEHIPASAKHLDLVLHAIDKLEPGRERAVQQAAQAGDGNGIAPPTNALPTALRKLAEVVRRRGILILISDLYEDPAEIAGALRGLQARGHDMIVFHVLDPAEREFPYDETTAFRDLETGERIPVAPDKLRQQYLEIFGAHLAELSKLFAETRIDYALLDTSMPLDHALFAYLSHRQRLNRARVRR